MPWPHVSYAYDGTFPGFLTCVYESYVNRERPACFSAPGEVQLSLYPERAVATHAAHARRVLASLPGKLSPAGARLVRRAFLTCLLQREKHIYDFIALGYERGPSVARDLTAPQVSTLVKAVTHLEGEAQLYRGFVRFSDVGGVLAGGIEPKNDVLPLLRPHFCSRYPDDPFVLYDRTHKKALFSQAGRWAILPLEEFHLAAPDAAPSARP